MSVLEEGIKNYLLVAAGTLLTILTANKVIDTLEQRYGVSREEAQQIVQQVQQEREAEEVDPNEIMHGPPASLAPIPLTGPPEPTQQERAEQLVQLAFDYIIPSESSGQIGKYRKPYRDHKGNWTIGVGHLIGNGSDEDLKKSPFYGRVLSDKEIEDLFRLDLKEHIDKVKRAFKDFDTYPSALQLAIIDGFYRGDLSGSPETKKLIRQGKYKQAALSYLDNREYRKAVAYIKKTGKAHGVAKRMKANADAIGSIPDRETAMHETP